MIETSNASSELVFSDGSTKSLRPKRNRVPECHPERKHRAFGLCHTCYNNKRRLDPVACVLQRQREARYRERHREELRLKSKLRYAALEQAGRGTCEICKKSNLKLCKDHNHLTDTSRGLLCSNCNLLLGHAKDDIDVLEGAIEYLKRYC